MIPPVMTPKLRERLEALAAKSASVVTHRVWVQDPEDRPTGRMKGQKDSKPRKSRKPAERSKQQRAESRGQGRRVRPLRRGRARSAKANQ